MKNRLRTGFTIVELLVVIVVIGILAVITIIGYVGVTQKAITATIQSDLSNGAGVLKMFQAENSKFPDTISCTIPDSTTNKCIPKSGSNNITYTYNNATSPQTFTLTISNGTLNYKITNDSAIIAITSAQELHSSSLISSPNLLAYYQLDNVNDHQGSYNLTNSGGAAFVSAKFGNGVDFGSNNSSKRLSYADTMGLNSNSAFTMMGWVNVNSAISSGGWRLLTMEHYTNYVYYMIYYEYNAGSPNIGMYRTKYGVGDSHVSQSQTLNIGSWYHLALTYDGTTLRGYINGSEIQSGVAASGNGSWMPNSNKGFNIGYSSIDAVGYSSVINDDVAVFNRALTAAEISNYYNGI